MKYRIGNRYIYIIWLFFLGGWCASCSTVKKLGEGEVLYTGVKKMNIETAEGVKLDGPEGAITSALAYSPNNPLYSPYVRTPFPLGLWVYNWNIKKQKGVKYWIYKKLSKKPVLISDVQPNLRLKLVENTAKEYGYFGVKTGYEVVYNKRNPKKAKLIYNVRIPTAHVIGNVEYWGWKGKMDTIVKRAQAFSLLKSGMQYDLYQIEQERERVSRLLRELGYYYFQADYIEFLVDTTRVRGVADVRVSLKHGVPAFALQVYRVGKVNLVLGEAKGEDGIQGKDSLLVRGVKVYYDSPLDLRPKVIARTVHLYPGDVFSSSLQQRTQANLARLGIFKYTNMEVSRVDSSKSGLLDVKVNAEYDLPVEMECELGVSSKSNNLLGPGLSFSITNKNAFRGGENLSFKLNGAYEWQTGKQEASSGLLNSYELGVDVGLSVPRLLVPDFLRSRKEFAERTNFQLGVDFLNRHSFFRMISFSGSTTYDFQSSRRMHHSVTPLKINYTYLLRTSAEFDETMANNPAIALSFQNQFIPLISYTNTYERGVTPRNPNRFYWQNTIISAGNLISAIQGMFGNREGGERTLFGNPYSQFLKATTELIVYRRVTENSQLAFRFSGGIGYAYGNSQVMPYSEQFYIGGANSIRAFTIRSLGPGSYHQETTNSTAYLDQTGDIKLDLNLEYRTFLFWKLNGAAFIDAGNVWNIRNQGIQSEGVFKFNRFYKQLAVSYGLGIRFDLDFLILRFDGGMKAVNPMYTGRDRYPIISPDFKRDFAFHFAVGYPF